MKDLWGGYEFSQERRSRHFWRWELG